MKKSQQTTFPENDFSHYPQSDGLDDPIVFPAEIIRSLAPVFDVSTTEMSRLLGMSRHIVWRKFDRREALSSEYQARAMGAVRIYVSALGLPPTQTVADV